MKERVNHWKRKWFSYHAVIEAPGLVIIHRRLGFFAYHLIKFFHGQDKLIEMGSRDDERQN